MTENLRKISVLQDFVSELKDLLERIESYPFYEEGYKFQKSVEIKAKIHRLEDRIDALR